MTPARHSVFRAMIISATTRATAMEVKFVTQDGLEVTVIQVNAAASAILRCLFLFSLTTLVVWFHFLFSIQVQFELIGNSVPRK